jgi:hypothetical protein
MAINIATRIIPLINTSLVYAHNDGHRKKFARKLHCNNSLKSQHGQIGRKIGILDNRSLHIQMLPMGIQPACMLGK